MMERKTRKPGQQGVHADGLRDHLQASAVPERLMEEEAKLRRRLERFCHPTSLPGRVRLAFTRWRLMRRIRARMIPAGALFLCGRSAGFTPA